MRNRSRSFIFPALIILSILFVIPKISHAANDITGWDKLKWGDTVSKANNIYGNSKYNGKKRGTSYYYFDNPATILTVPFQIIMGFNDEGGLIMVSLVHMTGMYKSDKPICVKCFDEIENVLISKYGQPEMIKNSKERTLKWTRINGRLYFNISGRMLKTSKEVIMMSCSITYSKLQGANQL